MIGAGRVGELVRPDVGIGELPPPVVPDAIARTTAEIASDVVPARVDGANRHSLPRLRDGKSEVAVVGDDDCSVDRAREDVKEHVGSTLTSEPFSSRRACDTMNTAFGTG